MDKIDLPVVDRFTTLNLRPWYWLALAHGARRGRSSTSACATRASAARGSRCARTRWRRSAWASPRCASKLLAYAIGAALGGVAGSFLGVVPEHGQRRPVPVLVLDLRPRDDHPRRSGQHLGGGRWAPSRCRSSTRACIPDVLNTLPGKSGSTSTSPQLGFGIFGFLLVIMMVLRPRGPDTERRHKLELDRRGEAPASDRRGAGVSIQPRRRRHAGPQPARRSPATAAGRGELTKQFGGLTAVNDVSFAVPERSIVSHHRSQRRRQDDVLQHAHRALQADLRAGSRFDGEDITGMRPDRHHGRAWRARSRTSGCSATMTAIENVHRRPALAHEGGPSSAPSSARRGVAARSARRARRRASCSTTSAFASAATTSRRDQPLLRRPAPASRSRGRWRPTPSSCCSTSRRRA